MRLSRRPRARAATDLLTPHRFDIPAKVIYARYWDQGHVPSWPLRLYDEHIRIWNAYHEEQPEKRGLEDFLRHFHDILRSVKRNGFDRRLEPVPLGKTSSPINGAHRIAASLVYGNKVLCRPTDEPLAAHDYSFEYFQGRAPHGRLSTAAADAIALEYIRLKPNTVLALLFPAARSRDAQVHAILSRCARTVYDRTVSISGNAAVNFVRMIYQGEPWLTSDDSFAGAEQKAACCFAKNGTLRLFVLESDNRWRLSRAKRAVRELFGIGNDSMHINDTHAETRRIAATVLNPNGIHWLRHRRLHELPGFETQVGAFITYLQERRLDPEEFCVTGSAVLSAYGLRECHDLDVLHRQEPGPAGLSCVAGSHSHLGDLYPVDVAEILSDPRHHFYYRGLKFLAPAPLKDMKHRRGEPKDRADIELMDRYLPDA